MDSHTSPPIGSKDTYRGKKKGLAPFRGPGRVVSNQGKKKSQRTDPILGLRGKFKEKGRGEKLTTQAASVWEKKKEEDQFWYAKMREILYKKKSRRGSNRGKAVFLLFSHGNHDLGDPELKVGDKAPKEKRGITKKLAFTVNIGARGGRKGALSFKPRKSFRLVKKKEVELRLRRQKVWTQGKKRGEASKTSGARKRAPHTPVGKENWKIRLVDLLQKRNQRSKNK